MTIQFIYLVSIISLQMYWDKYFEVCPNLSSRTYGSVWQGFGGTSHLRFSLSGVNPDKPFYETEWQSFVGTSHFC